MRWPVGHVVRTLVLVLITVCLLPGCLGFGVDQWRKVEWSQVASLNQDGWTLEYGDLVGPGLGVRITPRNRREATLSVLTVLAPLPPVPTWKSASCPFTIEIMFLRADEGFMFDPRGVTLQIADGPTTRSSGFSGCTGKNEMDAPFRVTQLACVLVQFDRQPPAPSEPFTLVIAGIEHHGLPVRVPPIRFEGASTGWHHR